MSDYSTLSVSKNLRATRSTAGLHQFYQRGILPAIAHSAAGEGEHVVSGGQGRFVPKISERSCKYKIFSDTVIFYTPDHGYESFLRIIRSSLMLLQFGFNGGQAPFRGAIGWGDLIDDSQSGILIGSALEDAYVGEQSQVWSGCILTEIAGRYCAENGFIANLNSYLAKTPIRGILEQWLTEYAAPLQKTSKAKPVSYYRNNRWVIDWTGRMFEGAAAMAFPESQSPHAKRIANNTVEFEGWARARTKS